MYALASQSSGGSWVLLILVYAVIFAGFWFIFIRPQRKEQKREGQNSSCQMFLRHRNYENIISCFAIVFSTRETLAQSFRVSSYYKNL